MVLSGYSRVPYHELYWSMSPDTHNKSVSKAISRNRFREIFSNLHIRDNTDIHHDHYHKVRLIFDIVTTNFETFVSTNKFSVNESMIYYGRHSTNQFSWEKPIQFGFKLWCLSSSDGYLLHAEPYCVKYTNLTETGWRQGSDVFLDIFTTLLLLDKLTHIGMYEVGKYYPRKQAARSTFK